MCFNPPNLNPKLVLTQDIRKWSWMRLINFSALCPCVSWGPIIYIHTHDRARGNYATFYAGENSISIFFFKYFPHNCLKCCFPSHEYPHKTSHVCKSNSKTWGKTSKKHSNFFHACVPKNHLKIGKFLVLSDELAGSSPSSKPRLAGPWRRITHIQH